MPDKKKIKLILKIKRGSTTSDLKSSSKTECEHCRQYSEESTKKSFDGVMQKRQLLTFEYERCIKLADSVSYHA